MRDVILIAGCEPLIAKGIKFYLEHQGYNTDIAYNESDILNKMNLKEYKLVILDVLQFKAYQKLIKKYDVNIILLISDEEDAADYPKSKNCMYMSKPIDMQRLKMFIDASLRRDEYTYTPYDKVIKEKGISIDTLSKVVTEGNRDINLTSKEYEILKLLVLNKNIVYSREELLKLIWGSNSNRNARTVDVHVRRLREKIEKDPANPEYIMTKWGEGYYFGG